MTPKQSAVAEHATIFDRMPELLVSVKGCSLKLLRELVYSQGHAAPHEISIQEVQAPTPDTAEPDGGQDAPAVFLEMFEGVSGDDVPWQSRDGEHISQLVAEVVNARSEQMSLIMQFADAIGLLIEHYEGKK